MEISGKTVLTGLLGSPVAHSISPAMHNAALAAAGLDYIYTAWEVSKENLSAAVAELKAWGVQGFNVTLPHKQAVGAFLDGLTPEEKRAGAVNTVFRQNGCYLGTNTDMAGFWSALAEDGFEPGGKTAVILGAGGAARAAAAALLQQGIDALYIVARDSSKAEKFAAARQDLRVKGFYFAAAEYPQLLQRAGLIVNATPLGMYPKVGEMPPLDIEWCQQDAVFYDLIYNPRETMFLRLAREAGHRVINGERMLVRQGALAFKLWTGCEPDEKIMLKALQQKLQQS